MPSGLGDETLERLRRKAEDAVSRARSPKEIQNALTKLLDRAEFGSEPFGYAHRHLAEIRLESDPWQAALHLRKALSVDPNDDILLALMGLAQALLSNYRASIASYRKAIAVAPRNPWYHHNLGHLLDVALDSAAEAKKHLEIAHELEADQHEITASLAHCLAQLGDLERAEKLAMWAARRAPSNRDHKILLKWIQNGAPPESGPLVDGPVQGLGPIVPGPSVRGPSMPPALSEVSTVHEVAKLVERNMIASGYTDEQRERAQSLWTDFNNSADVQIQTPAIFAAVVEYAVGSFSGIGGVTQAATASKYGIPKGKFGAKYGQMRDSLGLKPRDPRYRA
jgi:tetratricopeptide (TPR) repeat protein